jgi:hypothetical protein
MTDGWHLEYDYDDEVYTVSEEASSANIKRLLTGFDGVHSFYCAMSDLATDDCLWCVGEPDRRIVEGRLIGENGIFHFVVRRVGPIGRTRKRVRCGIDPAESVDAHPSEILTLDEALGVFESFREAKAIPPSFVPERKAYLFGSLSFGKSGLS